MGKSGSAVSVIGLSISTSFSVSEPFSTSPQLQVYTTRGTTFSKEFVAVKKDAQFYVGSILANITTLFKRFYVFSGGPFSPIGETFYL